MRKIFECDDAQKSKYGRRGFLKSGLAAVIGAIALNSIAMLSPLSYAQAAELEKEELKFGFIKLTDMAPLAIAYEKGFFEDEGLYVTLEAQANWKVLLDIFICWILVLGAGGSARAVGFGLREKGRTASQS